jgi:glycosyltransferase involved in cell wall biosynthesis
MNICHISPYAPSGCGLFEHARDMARADIAGGNNVIFVDAGITENGVRKEGVIGAVDDRAGFLLQTAHPDLIQEADVIIQHTGCYDIWTVKCQAPIIWAIHGRPLACFRPELQGKGESFSLYSDLSKWKRAKKMLYFWPEFTPYWQNVIPEEKLLCLDYPVIDQNRFNQNGDVYQFQNPGKYNFLICDSEREDIGIYELVNGCIMAAKKYPNLFKFHFVGSLDLPVKNCWNLVLGKLKELGALGDIVGRITNIESVYKASDCLISPNMIIVRTIAEGLSCGLPVIAEEGCKVADYTCNMSNPYDVLEAFDMFKTEFDNRKIDKSKIIERSKVFNMCNYSNAMNKVYQEICLK